MAAVMRAPSATLSKAPATLTLEVSTAFAEQDDDAAAYLMSQLDHRRLSLPTEMQRFQQTCDRFDRLYYAEDFTIGGADHWANHPSARTPGKAHVSVNSPASYVDIPAALQAVDPVENIMATEDSDDARTLASGIERIYTAWKQEDDFTMKFAQACTVKALYGRTAAKVTWDEEKKYPCVEIVDQPRNLYLGWGSTDYKKLDWAAYTYRLTPSEVVEEYGLDITGREYEGQIFPYVVRPTYDGTDRPSRGWLSFGPAMVECWDYWYRTAAEPSVMGKETKMDTWNAVFIGNVMVINARHPEYKGKLPYIPLFNSYIPGVPDGRAELYDMEQLIREKDERITAGAQMIGSTVAGQFWQLTGQDAPDRVPAAAKPKLNEVAAPGAGNRIEAITPFIPQFQLESYLTRLDREMAAISGLNDLLLGLAPASVLSSSKAINALVANYEAHISIKRQMLYAWRRNLFDLAVTVWQGKNDMMKTLFEAGYFLDIREPSLTPRDDLETATMALNLVNGKLWASKRGMDATGVDDPEQEENIIRGEQTDAALNPAAVAMMAQLMQTFAALQQPPPEAAQQTVEGQMASLQNNMRTAGGQATPDGTNAAQGQELQGVLPADATTPTEGGAPSEVPPELPPPEGGGAPGEAVPQPQPPQLQSMLMDGQLKSRVITKRNVPQKKG